MKITSKISLPRPALSGRRRRLCRRRERTPVRAGYDRRIDEATFLPAGALIGATQTWLDRSTEAFRQFARRLELDLVFLGSGTAPGDPVRLGDEVARTLRYPTLFVSRPTAGFQDPVLAEVLWRRVLIVLDVGVQREPAVGRAVDLAERMGVSSGTIVALHEGAGPTPGPWPEGLGWNGLSLPARDGDLRSLLAFCQNREVELIILMAPSRKHLAGSPLGTTGRLMQRGGIPLLAVPEM